MRSSPLAPCSLPLAPCPLPLSSSLADSFTSYILMSLSLMSAKKNTSSGSPSPSISSSWQGTSFPLHLTVALFTSKFTFFKSENFTTTGSSVLSSFQSFVTVTFAVRLCAEAATKLSSSTPIVMILFTIKNVSL